MGSPPPTRFHLVGQLTSRHLEGVTVVAIFLTIDDENANTELEKIGEVLPRIEV